MCGQALNPMTGVIVYCKALSDICDKRYIKTNYYMNTLTSLSGYQDIYDWKSKSIFAFS